MELFKEGYNCSQAVVLAFADLYDEDVHTLLKLSSSFGGGMGRLREVCGSVSGMFLVAGLLCGYDSPKDFEGKTRHYERIQQLAHEFRKLNGSIVCRELLGLNKKEDDFVPEKRTEEYYKKRPCMQLIGMSTAILERYLKENQFS
ncbi:MAG: C-GCAxxG-C-C family protein [Lachnoclostridium sp.]|nr:C-GCAxxG-C-C family protein [Lachnoclostridium sp.]MCM1383266.1 C-GCAxxG-C-C family protein [Lachnoclostridium sp.]